MSTPRADPKRSKNNNARSPTRQRLALARNQKKKKKRRIQRRGLGVNAWPSRPPTRYTTDVLVGLLNPNTPTRPPTGLGSGVRPSLSAAIVNPSATSTRVVRRVPPRLLRVGRRGAYASGRSQRLPEEERERPSTAATGQWVDRAGAVRFVGPRCVGLGPFPISLEHNEMIRRAGRRRFSRPLTAPHPPHTQHQPWGTCGARSPSRRSCAKTSA